MIRELLSATRPLVDGRRALEDVRALTAFHRVQASPGYDEAAAWLVGRLHEAGLHPEVVRVPADGTTRCLGYVIPEGWSCSHASARLVDGAGTRTLCDYDAQRLSLVLRSSPASGRYPLVALEDGTEATHYDGIDVRGRVVLTGGAAHRVHRLAVVERGAAGLLCDGRRLLPPVRSDEHDRDSIAYTSFWWAGDEPRGWGFVVSPSEGAALRRRLAQREPLELDVRIDSERFATTIPLVTATIAGGAPGEILLTSHLCHPQPSANDNGSGVAALLEAARALATLVPGERAAAERRTIRFLWMPEFSGTFAWIARDPDGPARTIAALNLDMVGEDQRQCGSTLLLEHPPYFAASFAEELLGRILAAARDEHAPAGGAGPAPARVSEVPYSGGSDHAVWIDPEIGVPCPMLIQWPDRYYHSSLDTIERVDPGSLALAARCAVAYAAFLARTGAAEREWMFALVTRGARRRLLAALERPDPAAAVGVERERAERAIAGLASLWLGVPARSPDALRLAALVRSASEEVDGFFEAEIAERLGTALHHAWPATSTDRRPVRLVRAPLDLQRHLIPGWAGLGREGQERWRAIERGIAGGSTALDLAWYACDGRRGIAEIAARVRLEGHAVTTAELEAWFELTARLGASTWSE